MMKSIIKKALVTGLVATAIVTSNFAVAQASAPVVCPGYKKGTTSLPGERTGKKVQKAFEAYNNDQIGEALNLLYEIKSSNTFDRAFTDRFIGNLLASQKGQGKKALKYLKDATKSKILNDSEHAGTLKLVADLSMQEENFKQAISYYEKWMKYTCKQDADVYTRIANAYYSTKQYAKIIAPADKAIALYKKPNKNPYALKLTSYHERKQYKNALKVAEELVRVFPDQKQWWSQLGFFYMLTEDYKKALSTFEMAYNQGYLSKKSEIKSLAQMYATNEIPFKAGQLMDKYLKSGLLEKTETNYASIANSYHQAKEHKKAAKFYESAARLSNDPEYYRKQGVLLLASEDYKGALKALKLALDNGSDKRGRIHMAMMEANFYTGKFRQAYNHVIEAKKDKSSARSARAWEPYIKEKAKNRGIRL